MIDNIKKKIAVMSLMFVSVAAISNARANDVTTISFEVVNDTSSALIMNSSSWDRSLAAPGYFDVGPLSEHSFAANYSANFTYPSKKPRYLRETLSYTNGEQECTYSVVLKVVQSFGVFSPTLSATREVYAASTGTKEAHCYAEVVEYDDSSPFDFSVEYRIS